MEKYTFTEPAVHAALADFVLLRPTSPPTTTTDQALMKRFGIIGPPATLFFIGWRASAASCALIGFEKAEAFAHAADASGQ